MNELNMLQAFMRERSDSFKGNYYIPKSWSLFGYRNSREDSNRPGELNVNPYDFFCASVDEITCKNINQAKKSGVSEDIIYSILPRSFTAWAHYDKTDISSGTFLKTIFLLPMLKKLNVSILYLLPVFSCSDRNKKGKFGSPYAIKDIYRLDKGLHDPLLGHFSEEMLEIEFKAFVEACHLMGIKVMVDFVFRTVARDNVLIKEHPDWFYWIKRQFNSDFKPPIIGDGQKSYCISDKTVKMLYSSPKIDNYLSQFTLPPNQLDKSKWEKIKTGESDNTDSLIEESFDITTVPGFPDVVNDRQPAWSDVTYLKYYFDYPPELKKYIPQNQAPYIMQDGASLNRYHGEEKNEELWKYIIGVLPFYKKIYNIDGARIDMAHALPDELNTLIIKEIKEIDKQFILWSEELDPAKGTQAKDSGFDFISGYTYYDYKNVNKSGFNKAIIEDSFLKSELPVTGSLETPDTPRSAYIHKKPGLLALLILLNGFMPNSIPMINSGQELLEIQPMNLGLDNDENGRYLLPKDDPMYGKLAFFDMYRLHWQNENKLICNLLQDTFDIRKKYEALVTNRNNFIPQPDLARHKKLTVLCYYDKAIGEGLLIAANRSDSSRAILDFNKHLPACFLKSSCAAAIYDIDGKCQKQVSLEKILYLKPLEVKIIEFKD